MWSDSLGAAIEIAALNAVTAKDTERMSVGLVPWSILLGSNTEGGTDDVHYNTYGLQSVCNAVYAKGQTLSY